MGSLAGAGALQLGASDPNTLLFIAGSTSTTFSGRFQWPRLHRDRRWPPTLTVAGTGNVGTIGGDLDLCLCDDRRLTIRRRLPHRQQPRPGRPVLGGTLNVINGGTLQVGNTPGNDLLVASNMIICGAGSSVTVNGFTGVGIFGPGSLHHQWRRAQQPGRSGVEFPLGLGGKGEGGGKGGGRGREEGRRGGGEREWGGEGGGRRGGGEGTPQVTVTGPGSTWNVGGSASASAAAAPAARGAYVSNGGVDQLHHVHHDRRFVDGTSSSS